MLPGQTASAPAYAKPGAPKSSYPWYLDNIDKNLVPETQELLEKYSGIPRDEQSKHVHEIRDQAWAISTYPCTGLGVWLLPYLARCPARARIVDRLKSGGTMMDIGCFLGGDFRLLAYDGAPTDKMVGIDIVSHWDVGFNLFRDQSKFHAKFIEVDVLSTSNAQLNELEGHVDIVSVSAVLHQWTAEKQLEAARRIVQFTSGPGAMVVGHQIGNLDSRNQSLGTGTEVFRHNPASWSAMWEIVGKETGTKWDASEASMLTWEDMSWDPRDHAWMNVNDRVLGFVVTRLE